MSVSDLHRLIHQATPRIEDVRAPDRRDIIRREHGHMTLREVIDAADALEFSAQAFREQMDALLDGGDGPEESDEKKYTAVHGLHRATRGLQLLSPGFEEPAPPAVASDLDEAAEGEAPAEQLAEAAAAKGRGAECIKQKDYAGAEAEYTAAIKATPRAHPELHTLFSNRCAARLHRDATAALADARRCIALKPDWPKGHFREGSCLRELDFLREATKAFRAGKALEPENKDWEKEVEKTEQRRCLKSPMLVRQVLFMLLPEFLSAWAHGNDPSGVLQVQLNGDMKDLGVPKWRLVREGKTQSKAQLRYAFLSRKDYLTNLAANLQNPPADHVAVVDIDGKPLKIVDIASFVPEDDSGHATLHVDIRNGAGSKMIAVICRVPCDEVVRRFLGKRKTPDPPKGAVANVLGLQRTSGFPKALPKLLGFQSFPGDLNYPVIDLARDAPEECK